MSFNEQGPVKSDNVELVVDAKAALGEGPIWHGRQQVLYWVDILGGQLHLYYPTTNARHVVNAAEYISAVAPRRSGGLIIVFRQGFASLDLETQRVTLIHRPKDHPAGNRFNDGGCDPAGRFWAGTMSLEGDVPEAGCLYCMDGAYQVRRMLDKVTISNGLAWSLDHHTMYYIDTPTRVVAAFDYDLETGAISNRRLAVAIPEGSGYPDGMTIDEAGMLWVAHWEGSRVTRWDPTSGRLLQTVPIPATLVTSCCFGGPHLDELYVTTARVGLDPGALAGQPHAGGLFRVHPGVRGVAAYEFAG